MSAGAPDPLTGLYAAISGLTQSVADLARQVDRLGTTFDRFQDRMEREISIVKSEGSAREATLRREIDDTGRKVLVVQATTEIVRDQMGEVKSMQKANQEETQRVVAVLTTKMNRYSGAIMAAVAAASIVAWFVGPFLAEFARKLGGH